jgi:hypothetical protein
MYTILYIEKQGKIFKITLLKDINNIGVLLKVWLTNIYY